MDDIVFGCDRQFIDKFDMLQERNFLSAYYCYDYFEGVSFTDLYYRVFKSNAILTLVCVLAIVPIINFSLFHIAQKFIAPIITNFRRNLKWNPITTSFTLMAITNGIPSVTIQLMQWMPLQVHKSIGAVYGSFIFSVTIVSAAVVWTNPREVKMPKYAVIRELVFFLASVIVVIVFAFIGHITYVFVAVYFLIYLIYLLASISMEKIDKIEDNLEDFEFKMVSDTSTFLKKQAVSTTKEVRNQQIFKASQMAISNLDFEVNFDIKTGDEEKKKNSDSTALFFTIENLTKIWLKEVMPKKIGLLECTIEIPINLLCLFVFPSSKNPLIKSPIRPFILAFSLWFSLLALKVIGLKLWIFIIVILLASTFFYFLKIWTEDEKKDDAFLDFMAIFTGICLTKIYVSLFSDVIRFFKFYYSIDDIIVSTIFLSAANSLGEFYINIALATQGELILAILSTYSVQTFQNLVGFSMTAASRIGNNFDDFDVFNLHRPNQKLNGNNGVSKALIFISTEIGLLVAIIVIILIYYRMNRYIVKSNFPKVLALIYVTFSIYSLFMG